MSEFELLPQAGQKVWVVAALFAVTVHAGGIALAVASMQPDETAQDLGAPAIEIGVELTTPRINPTGLPVGPDTEASIASPAMVEQEKVVKETDLPKAVPTETDEPARVVTVNNSKQPTDDDPRPASQEAHASTETVAAEETATPTIEAAVQSPRSVTPAPGTGESRHRDAVTWQRELAAHFDKHKSYPSDRTAQSAEVVISFVLDRTGHILVTRVVRGSGDSSFDAAALAMLQRSDPVPTPPPLVADEGLTFTLPVIFHAKSRTD
jgi:periplasmic protein TonB